MGQRLLPALCGGGMVATRMMGRKVLVRRASRHPSSDSKQLPTAGGARVGGGCKAVKQSAPGGGGYHVNCNGALMVEMAGGGRRVMVVADGRKEAAGALQWALSQVVRSNDTLVLLSVVKPVAHEVSDSRVKILEPKCSKHIEAMKNICESTRPEVKVETCVVEAEERAPAVVEAARRHGASLLVLGQHRRLGVARWLQALWRRWRRRVGTVDFCIEHAPCVALGVRRRRSGGYLLSSKSHKDFWLLA